ncbi:MAG: radical SAM protein [Armatimonadota bacterium]
MRILLISGNRERAPQPAIPLGMCLVASSLAARQFEVRVLDLCFARDAGRAVAEAVREWQPDAVGLSVRNLDNGDYLRPRSFLGDTRKLVAAVRPATDAPVIVGGPAVNVAPAGMLEALAADYAVGGDGEETLPALLQALQAGRDPSRMAGVYVRGIDGMRLPAEPMARVQEVETLPFAQVAQWLDLRRYLRYGCPVPIQTKRGCQFGCIYCTYCRIEGARYRLRSPESVAAEMWEAAGKWKVRRFEFVDSTFSHPLDHAVGVCEALASCGLRAKLHTSGLHPGSTSRELLQLMRRAGFEAVVCTPDSGSERILERLRKGFSLGEVARTAAWAREAELPMLWSFVFGAPGEDEGTVRATLRFAEAVLAPQDRLLCTLGLRVYPDTELARVAVEEGVLSADADLLAPSFYFSPEVTPARVLALLDGSKLRRQMALLTSLQSPLLPIGLRLRHALRLPGPPWTQLPLYNLVSKLTGMGPRPRRQ